MMEFEAGAIFGMCMTVTLMLVFLMVFGQDDDSDDDGNRGA